MPLQTPLKTGAWDPEEDELLYYWQSKVGNKWAEVAKHIPGRTGQQCAQRWRHKVNPNIRRDKWTDEEDAHLMELVKTFGIGKWAEIARHMQGRTDQQCMGRWRRHLDPNIRRDSWSAEEDARLRVLYAQYGTSWSRISKALKGRTSQQCRARWHQLDSGRSRRTGGGGGGGSGGGGGGEAGAAQRAVRAPALGARRSGARRRVESSDSEEDEEDVLTESDCDADAAAAKAAAQDFEGVAQQQVLPMPLALQQLPLQQLSLQPLQPPFLPAPAAAGFALPPEMAQQQEANAVAPQQPARVARTLSADAAMLAPAGPRPQRTTSGGDDDGTGLGGRSGSDSVLASARRRLAARKQQQHLPSGDPAAFLPLSPPRRPPRAPAAATLPAAGATTPRGATVAESPGILSPSLMSPPSSAQGRGGRAGYDGGVPGGSPGWQQLAQASGLDDDEAAGAETLAHIAVVFRRGSGDLEPPGGSALRRSDFITGHTPTKRNPGSRPEARLSDDLSPSPFKKPRSFSSTLGAELLEGMPDFRRRLAAAAAAADAEQAAPATAPAALRSGGRRLTAKRSGARRGGGALPFGAPPTGLGPRGDDAMDDAGIATDSDDPIAPVGFELDVAADLIGGGCQANGSSPLPPPRPSNASALTIAPLTVAGLASPPSGGRVRWGGADAATPGRPVANLLASPNFDRLATGCATPTAHPHSQPSPATLALLQSPQASAMLEPFWTPNTGLAKEALLRDTSETPDRPSAARLKAAHVRGLFSPPSSGKAQATPAGGLAAAMAAAAGAAAAAAASTAGAAAAGDAKQQRGAVTGLTEAIAAAAAEAAASAAAPDALPLASAATATAGSGHGRTALGMSTASAVAGADSGAGMAASSHHRVVRRLDQHEAWGAATGGPRGAAAFNPSSSGSSPARVPGELISPPKRARVPLFCEDVPSGSSNGAVGSPPPRAVGVRLEFDGLGPGRARGAGGSSSGGPGPAAARSYEPSRLNPASGARAPMGAAQLRSPRRVASWKVPPASAQLSSPPGSGGPDRRRLPLPQAVLDAAANIANAPPPAPAPATSLDGQLPGTPQHGRMPLDGQQSTSATPTTPSFRPAAAQQGAGSSPSDYVTPQQRVRLAPPTAPLHRDCLLSAAASAAARLAAAAAPAHDTDGPGTVSSKDPRCSGAAEAAAAAASNAAEPALPPAAADAQLRRQREAAPSPVGAQVAESSRMSASPAAPLGASPCTAPSPSWGPGMIAMLRGLQRTPLAVRRPLDGAALAEAVAGRGPAPSSPPAGSVAGSLQAHLAPGLQLPSALAAVEGVNAPAPFATPAAAAGLLHATPALQASLVPGATPLPLPGGFVPGGAPLLPGGEPLVPGGVAAVASAMQLQGYRPGPGSDTSSNKENADEGVAAAVADAAAAAAAALAAPSAPAAAGHLPATWLQGGGSFTMHLVPVKVQLAQGGGSNGGTPGDPAVRTLLAAGAPRAVGAVTIAPQPNASVGAGAGEARGSAEARSRLHALLQGGA